MKIIIHYSEKRATGKKPAINAGSCKTFGTKLVI